MRSTGLLLGMGLLLAVAVVGCGNSDEAISEAPPEVLETFRDDRIPEVDTTNPNLTPREQAELQGQ